ncbi:hypothetical protein COCON_G00069320 [Conger conger]|uniref:Cadherin domain-containing protein n=1 Tax=Conger conger TaxID=82655 RepID=A0A9Q1DSY5_CONCO|nr:hypothetical protein COCON_G00069320 [Conger conger]
MARIALPSIGLLLLLFLAVFKLGAEGTKSSDLRRWKREWVIPPQKLEENTDYTHREYIAKIRSDLEDEGKWKGTLKYSLKGIGASEDPVNLFVVNPNNGFVKITGILDREKIAMYNLSGVARYANGDYAEKDIELRVKVVDHNDCSPVFEAIPNGEVDELSPGGAVVMKVAARDDDEPGNPNSQIAYSIINQEPGGENMFDITEDGNIIVAGKLDREVQDTYVLTLRGKDLNGRTGGNTGTGTVTIYVKDVNDNPPTLELDHYEGSVMENTQGVEVLRFKALDDDIENTDNWLADFEIQSGNEAGYFEIETDPKTNEGILKLVKPMDYEDIHELDLQVAVANKAPFHPSVTGGGGGGGSSSWSSSGAKTYPIKIKVQNEPEGPRFRPEVKAVPISEDSKSVNLKDVIVKYPAIDGDTGLDAKNVRYVKGFDPDNWLVIDEETAEVRLNKLPDRESKYLVNGTYFAKVLCISQDMPGKTATGTIALQVEDFNDHCPTLTTTSQDLCTDDKVVYATAQDEDDEPHGAPFQFTIIPEDTTGGWVVESLNATSVILRTHDNLWPGAYKVALEVADQQGHSCPDKQVMEVQVCTCKDPSTPDCSDRAGSTGASFGGAGVGLLILGALMLLLIPLLLMLCNCGGAGAGGAGFSEIAFDTKEHLIAYHTEGKGEDKEVPVLSAPVEMAGGYITAAEAGQYAAAGAMGMGMGMGAAAGGGAFLASQTTVGGGGGSYYHQGGMEVDYMSREEMLEEERLAGARANYEMTEGSMYDGIALSEDYLGQYYSQKAGCVANDQKDSLLLYDCEGNGSLAGSVGCCSLLEADNDLEFLNDLGPKFKTLAAICGGRTLVSEAEVAVAAPKPAPVESSSSAAMFSEHSASALNVSSAFNVSSAVNMAAAAPAASMERSVFVENNYATLPKMNIQESVVVPSQTYVVQQQPMYYAAAPVLQPVQYMMEPHVQYVMSDAPVIGGAAVHGGVIGMQQGTLNRGENVVLVERQMSSGQVLQQGVGGLNQGLVLVDGQMGAGQVVHGGQTWIQQGTLQRGPISGSQNILLVEGATGQGVQNGVITQGKEIFRETGTLRGPASLMSLNTGPIQVSGPPGSQKVVVQEKRVVSSSHRERVPS